MEHVQPVLDKLDKQFGQTALVKKASEASGRKPGEVVLGGFALAGLLMWLIFGIAALSNAIAMLPLYSSIKALKSKEKDDDTQWLTYWIVFGALTVVESFLLALYTDETGIGTVGFLYYIVKAAFLLWAGNSQTQGARKVYVSAIAPLFDKIEAFVEPKKVE